MLPFYTVAGGFKGSEVRILRPLKNIELHLNAGIEHGFGSTCTHS